MLILHRCSDFRIRLKIHPQILFDQLSLNHLVFGSSKSCEMTSHIPLALSLLGTFASHYPLTSLNSNTASKPPPPPSVAPSAPQTASNSSTSSTPGNASGPIPTTNPSGLPQNPSNNSNNTPGTSPPTSNPLALCEVSTTEFNTGKPKSHPI